MRRLELRSTSRLTVLGATGTTLMLWASAFVLIRVALADFSPGGLSLARLLVASAALALVARVVRVRRPAARDAQRIAWCGATGMTAYQLLLNAGERTVDAGTASFLVNCGPVVAALIAFVFLKERISIRGWIGIAIGCAGGTVIALSHGSGFELTSDALWVVGAAVAQSAFFVIQKPLLVRYTGLEVTCYATWAGTLLALPLLPTLVADAGGVSSTGVLVVVLLGIGPSAVGYATWAYVQARGLVGVTTNALYLVPFVSVGMGWALLDEVPTLLALAGGAMAIVGVAISRSGSRTAARATHTRVVQAER